MNFRRWVAFTLLIHVLVIVIDKGGGIVLYLLTRNQPREHGLSGIVATLPFLLMAVANLGLASSLVYFVRRQRYTPQQAFETTASAALVWGGGLSLLALLLFLVVLPGIGPGWTAGPWFATPMWKFNPWLVVPFCATVPLLLLSSYTNCIQLATDRVRGYGAVQLAGSVAFLPAFFALFFAFGGSVAGGDVPLGVAWGRLFSTLLVTLLALWLVRNVVRLRLGLHRGFLRDGVAFGWKANLTSTLAYLNQRIDLPILGALYVAHGIGGQGAADAALEQVAYYSMAVTWAELVWHFPEAMRDLLFSKVAGSSAEHARQLTPVVCRLGLALAVFGSATVLLAVNPVMSTITWFVKSPGEPNSWTTQWSGPVFQSLLLLSPGTVAYTVSKVLQADLGARDRMSVCVTGQLLLLATMLGLDFLWMPRHGAAGAAAASTVAYVVSTAWTLRVYLRENEVRWWTCLVVQRTDLVYFRELLSTVAMRLRLRKA
jgi:hypothetical protein